VILNAVVTPVNIAILLGAMAALGVVVGLVMRSLEQRERRALENHIQDLWTALVLARHDLRLEVNERGERFLHGTVRGQRYTLENRRHAWWFIRGPTFRNGRHGSLIKSSQVTTNLIR
jgi:hypothetical protein